MANESTSTSGSKKVMVTRSTTNLVQSQNNQIDPNAEKLATMPEQGQDILLPSLETDRQTAVPSDLKHWAKEISETVITQVTEKMSCLEKKLTEKMSGMKNDLLDNFSKIENKVQNLYQQFSELKNEVTTDVKNKLTEMKQEIDVERNLALERQKKEFREEIAELKSEHQAKINCMEEKFKDQEAKINEMEKQSNSRAREDVKRRWTQFKNNLIISGPSVISAVDGDQLSASRKLLKDQLRMTEGKLRGIRQARTLGKETNGAHKILLEFESLELKDEIRHLILTTKPHGLFVGEQLTTDVNNLFFKLRKIRRESRSISTLFTRHGEIIVKKNINGTTYKILTQTDLDEFLKAAGLTENSEN